MEFCDARGADVNTVSEDEAYPTGLTGLTIAAHENYTELTGDLVSSS